MRTAFRHTYRLSVAVAVIWDGFNVPATMNGSTTAINSMTRIAVNSSGLFASVGTNFPNSFALYATSANGSTWTTPALMNGTTTGVNLGFSGIAVNSSGLFVAIGTKAGGSINPVYATSANGSTWTSPALFPGTNTGIMNAITVNSSGLFVAVGNTVSGYPSFATSDNGSTWTTPAAINGTTIAGGMTGITINSAGLFVAVGYNSTNSSAFYPWYATSTNGSTWTTPAIISSSVVIGSGTISYPRVHVKVNSAGLFVMVMSDGNTSGLTYPARYSTSTNGSTWTTPASVNGVDTLAYISDLAVSSSGVFVAVGAYTNKPAYAYSLNGTQWSTPVVVSGAGDGQLSGVTATSSNSFVAVGIDGNTYPIYATSK